MVATDIKNLKTFQLIYRLRKCASESHLTELDTDDVAVVALDRFPLTRVTIGPKVRGYKDQTSLKLEHQVCIRRLRNRAGYDEKEYKYVENGKWRKMGLRHFGVSCDR